MRFRRPAVVLVLTAALFTAMPSEANATPPGTPDLPRRIDSFASYDAQDTCSPSPKPGTVAFRDMVLRAYPGSADWGISRDCAIGGTSEHKEGRAWDWHMPSATAATELLGWLLEEDDRGRKNGRARRIGIMYIIYNDQIWGAYEHKAGWRPYACSDPTHCHRDHVHFSFSWDGANKQTSWWDSTPVRHKSTGLMPGDGKTPLPTG